MKHGEKEMQRKQLSLRPAGPPQTHHLVFFTAFITSCTHFPLQPWWHVVVYVDSLPSLWSKCARVWSETFPHLHNKPKQTLYPLCWSLYSRRVLDPQEAPVKHLPNESINANCYLCCCYDLAGKGYISVRYRILKNKMEPTDKGTFCPNHPLDLSKLIPSFNQDCNSSRAGNVPFTLIQKGWAQYNIHHQAQGSGF